MTVQTGEHETAVRPAAAPAGLSVLAVLREAAETLTDGLEGRFLDNGVALAAAVDTIHHLTTSLGKVLAALDTDTAVTAIAGLRDNAMRFVALPALQADRMADIAAARHATDRLYAQFMAIREALRQLGIIGSDLRMTIVGSPEFASFLDDMFARLDDGDRSMDEMMVPLRALVVDLATVQRAARRLTGECQRLIPLVPDRLVQDAEALRAHQVAQAAAAAAVIAISADVRERVSAALEALQIGDITRQRFEHAATAIALVERHRADLSEAGQAHLLWLIAAQIAGAGADFTDCIGTMRTALRALVADARHLLTLVDEGAPSDRGRHFLHGLQRDIAELDDLTLHLRTANERALMMSTSIAATADGLMARIGTIRSVRIDVEQVAANAVVRIGYVAPGDPAAATVVDRIGHYAGALATASAAAKAAIRDLADTGGAIRGRHHHEAQLDGGLRLEDALGHVREGCRRTDEAIAHGCFDSHELVGMLEEAGDRLAREMRSGTTAYRLARRLRDAAGLAPAPDTADDAATRDLLARIAALYSMSAERRIHAAFLFAGMAWIADRPPAHPVDDPTEDILF